MGGRKDAASFLGPTLASSKLRNSTGRVSDSLGTEKTAYLFCVKKKVK